MLPAIEAAQKTLSRRLYRLQVEAFIAYCIVQTLETFLHHTRITKKFQTRLREKLKSAGIWAADYTVFQESDQYADRIKVCHGPHYPENLKDKKHWNGNEFVINFDNYFSSEMYNESWKNPNRTYTRWHELAKARERGIAAEIVRVESDLMYIPAFDAALQAMDMALRADGSGNYIRSLNPTEIIKTAVTNVLSETIGKI
jgi:hypothetical protein